MPRKNVRKVHPLKPVTLTSLADLASWNADTIIDVRAPAEYAHDHIPGSINLPVLDDAQRAEVGTLYRQVNRFQARKIGGALVAQNTAAHLQGPLADKEGGWQPLVYCWRGGQRSGAFATILDQVGWRVRVLDGGYRSYRRKVTALLYDAPLDGLRLVVVAGGTGTGKTALLHALSAEGAQVLDIEGLAEHRGSLFGRTGVPQPSQKMFETRLAAQITGFDRQRTVFVESESSKVGDCTIPPSLWARMADAPRIHITAPLASRTRFLCDAYGDITQDATVLDELLDKLRPYHAGDRVDGWKDSVAARNWPALAEGLITHHYDPRYDRSGATRSMTVDTIDLPDLSEATLAVTARDLAARFS